MKMRKLFFHKDGEWHDYDETSPSFRQSVENWWKKAGNGIYADIYIESLIMSLAAGLGTSVMTYNKGEEVGLKTCNPAPGALMQVHTFYVHNHEFIKTTCYGQILEDDYFPFLGHLMKKPDPELLQ